MLVVDSEGRAAMTIGPYIRPNATKDELLRRAALSLTEAKECGVAPEVLWAKTRDGEILYQLPNTAYAGGLTQLVEDLLKTKGFMPLRKDEIDSADVAEFFLVSDEHGIVVPDKMESELAESLQADYLKLCETRAKEAKEGHRG